jgi:cyclopropane fatty-acyl-phospholipid synthase-like methyltransferase
MMASSCFKSQVSDLIGNMKTSSGKPDLSLARFIIHNRLLPRGLFIKKYVLPGADSSCSLYWIVSQVEAAGFKVKNIDVLGVHYSATLYRWYKNWVNNKDKSSEIRAAGGIEYGWFSWRVASSLVGEEVLLIFYMSC